MANYCSNTVFIEAKTTEIAEEATKDFHSYVVEKFDGQAEQSGSQGFNFLSKYNPPLESVSEWLQNKDKSITVELEYAEEDMDVFGIAYFSEGDYLDDSVSKEGVMYTDELELFYMMCLPALRNTLVENIHIGEEIAELDEFYENFDVDTERMSRVFELAFKGELNSDSPTFIEDLYVAVDIAIYDSRKLADVIGDGVVQDMVAAEEHLMNEFLKDKDTDEDFVKAFKLVIEEELTS